MQREEFNALVADAQARNPAWFALERDPPASGVAVADIERKLSVKLPTEFVDFLSRYGAGHFAFALVLGVEAASVWEIVSHLNHVPPGFLPASDAGTGDYYGFCTHGSRSERAVSFFEHDSGKVVATQFCDLYEMLAQRALEP